MKVAVAAAVVAALACASAALADDPTVRLNAKDQAKARAALLKRSELGTSGWTGGAIKPSKLQAPNCPGFDPKESDLVVTGHAEAQFQHQGLQIDHDVQVMQQPSFVRTDFARTTKPQLARCLGYLFTQSAPAGTKVVSAKKVAFPRVGDVTAAYRITIAVTQQGTTVNVIVDFVFFGKGRTEHSLSLIGPEAAAGELALAEQRLARIAVARSAS